MTDTFQWSVIAACWIIALMFIVQAGALIGVYLLIRKVSNLAAELKAKVEPQIPKLQATLADVQKTVAHVTETTNQLTTEVKAVSAAVTTSAERVSAIATESAEEIRSLVSQASADIKSMVSTTSHEVTDLVIQSSTQVKGIVSASSNTAHGTMDRVDLAVERTVGRFEDTGTYVQESVLTPVREVAAIVTGIKVALETLLGYPERKQIDQAYTDEELFI